MAAVSRSGITKQILLCIGFGVDHFHGVSHFRFLENVATLAKKGAYHGMWQMLQEMPEAQRFIEAVHFANEQVKARPSIVCNSIASALQGNYGDVHFSSRTKGSDLWINPLMATYWCFDLRKVVSHIHYYEHIRDTNSMHEISHKLQEYRNGLSNTRPHRDIPL